ncbi:unnamed protein product [Adineta steineri]|uniref:N-acetylgalactosaminide beta-1,3-galactosyltransferase n=1 Tax=Adineta steineri TaxID=433720 RepID=A0A815XB86_9BILA|nr:unnamed protein product [Adineta steineri]CAF1555311.1 unnamed protein product [Adineta steineri]
MLKFITNKYKETGRRENPYHHSADTKLLLNFEPKRRVYHDRKASSRFESVETWRDARLIKDTSRIRHIPRRKHFRALDDTSSTSFGLQQILVSEYPEGAEKIFFMIKTGGTELWKKLPVHFFASLPKMPKFGLYSDAPGSIAGYEVIDSLANLTESIRNSELFEMYRLHRDIHDNHGIYDYSETKLNNAWDLDKFKNIPILLHAYENSNCDWFFMVDTDSYVMVESLVDWLKGRDPNKPYYHGSIINIGVPFAHGGSGILVSRKAIEMTVASHREYLEEYEQRATKDCCGDRVLGLMLFEKGKIIGTTGEASDKLRPFQGNTHWDVEVTEMQWCLPVLSFHHVSPHDIELLWEYEQIKEREGSHVTYGDIYRDFYQPYITDVIENWDNNARDVQIHKEEGKQEPSSPAWKSFEECKATCERDEKCLTYRTANAQAPRVPI